MNERKSIKANGKRKSMLGDDWDGGEEKRM